MISIAVNWMFKARCFLSRTFITIFCGESSTICDLCLFLRIQQETFAQSQLLKRCHTLQRKFICCLYVCIIIYGALMLLFAAIAVRFIVVVFLLQIFPLTNNFYIASLSLSRNGVKKL